MVLYKIVDLKILTKKPIYIFLISAFFVLFGFLTAFFVFISQFSIAMISFSSMMILPYVIKVIESEDTSRSKSPKGHFKFLNIFKRHDKVLLVFVFMFLGMVIEYTMLFAFVPPKVTDIAFKNQLDIIFRGSSESAEPLGAFFKPGFQMEFFIQILSNNLAIVIIAFVLSLFYGLGAIFILNYNASIAAVIYGSSIRTLVWTTPNPIFGNIFLYLPHTILEILGFLLAAVAGAIIMKSEILGRSSNNVYMKDSIIILIAAVALIFVAAVVEVTVPFIFY